MSAEGFRLRVALARQAVRHGTPPVAFDPLPPFEPAVGDVIIEGYASTPALDRTRTVFRHDCWSALAPEKIPLLFKHDRVGGKILDLKTTPQGLFVRALVTDREAARCQFFSFAASVLSFTYGRR